MWRSGTFVLTVVCLLLCTGWAGAAADGVYTGTTSQGRAISITVSGGQITKLVLSWVCGPASTEQTTNMTCSITSGSFSCGTATCIPYTSTVHIEGAFTGDSVTGTYDLRFKPDAISSCCALNDIGYSASIGSATPEISIGDIQVTEGDNGTTVSQFQLTLGPAAASTVTVDWATADGTADSSDYEVGSGTVSFSVGQTSRTIDVTVYGDTDEETDEVFFVGLSNPTNAQIADAQGQCTILDDDGAGPLTLYDQTDNSSDTGIPDQNYDPTNDLWDCEAADDFVVPGGGWQLDQVQVLGFYSDPGGPADSVNVWLYPDSGGWPGTTPSCSYTDLAPTSNGAGPLSAGTVVIDLPTPCALAAGGYWLAVQINMSYGEGGDYYWVQRTTQNGSGAVWRNPGDAWETGATSWTRLPEVEPGTDPDLIFLLADKPATSSSIFADDFETGDCDRWSAVAGMAP